MDENLTLEVTLNEKDIFEYNKGILYRHFNIVTIMILGILGFIISIFLFSYINNSSLHAILVFLNFLISARAIRTEELLKRNSKIMFFKSLLLRDTSIYVFNENGFTVTTQHGFRKLEWKELYGYLETKYMFLLFIAPNSAFILPKRAINDDQKQILADYLKRIYFKADKFGAGDKFFFYLMGVNVISVILFLFTFFTSGMPKIL